MSDIITEKTSALLVQVLRSSLGDLSTRIPSSTLNQVIQRACAVSGQTLTLGVSGQTNDLINTLPQQLSGVKNPVDLITSSLGSAGITSNLDEIVTRVRTPSAVTQLSLSIVNQLKQTLPLSLQNQVDFTQLEQSIISSITPGVKDVVSSTLADIVKGVFEVGNVVPPVIENIESLQFFNGAASTETLEDLQASLEKASVAHATGIAASKLVESSNFNIKETENENKLRVLSQGFTDPDASYPTAEYSGTPETNKLATEDVTGTVVQDKDRSRMTGAKLPGGESWDQPPSPYRAKYPYNKVTQTESGHIIEVDDTPGSERLHIYHRSGTFVEIDANGAIVKRTVGSSYEIIDKNGKIAIAGKADISVNGACNIFVGNDANIEVEGDTNIVCHNDITAQAGGKFNLSSVEEFNITSNIINIESYTNTNIKVGNNYYLHTGNDLHVLANGNSKTQVVKNNYFKTGENLYQQTIGDVYYKSTGTYFNESQEVNYVVQNNFNLDSSLLYMNSGTSTGSQDSVNSVIAGQSNIGIINGRKDVVPINIGDPLALTLGDNFKLNAEELATSSEEAEALKSEAVLAGIVYRKEYDALPVAVESAIVTTRQTTVLSGDTGLLKVKKLPGNYKLSPNYTLEMLTNKAAITSYSIPESGIRELPYGKIVYNLHVLALNVLEPIYGMYPSTLVVSGFRLDKYTKSSQHGLGQAVDIQFKGMPREDYFEAAKKIAQIINYDQLLLEYSAESRSPWIHISIIDPSFGSNRRQCMTLNNHQVYSSGLTKLA